MADVLKYGWVGGGKIGIEKKVSNSYFLRTAGAFVAASGPDGVKLVTASTDLIMGWAEVPRDTSAGTVDYWQRSSTSDTVFVITDPEAIFAMPVLENVACLKASLEGYAFAASLVGSGTTGYQKVQCRRTTTAGNMQLDCIKVDTTNKVMFVRMNPYQRHA